MDAHTHDSAAVYALATIKWLFTINGIALFGVLLFIGSLIGKTIPTLDTVTFVTYLSAYSIFFITGIVLAVSASFFGYISYACRNNNFPHMRYQVLSMACAVSSMAVFVAGSLSCIYAFTNL